MLEFVWMWVSFALVALLGVVIWSIRRHRSPKAVIHADCGVGDLMPTLAGLTLSTSVGGNSVEVLENGRFFDVLEERIRAASRTVHFETFLWKPGTLGTRLAHAFMEKARAGVRVRILLDAQGSSKIEDDLVARMRESGCTVKFFHEKSIHTIGVLNDRTHRKMCILDGQEAFVGGHCVTDEWLGNAEDHTHWSDVSVLVRGPGVHSVQGAFSENWAGTTGEMIAGDSVFPKLQKAGDITMHAAFVKPENSAPAVKILHHAVLCMARERIWIQNPYFIPKYEAIDAMAAAVRRGVDVRVLMPSPDASDSPLVQHAGRYHFERLLEGGVRLFEYPHTLLHQKIMTVDGCWSAVGSTNFDDRSFDTNDEITLSILDKELAAQFDAIFERYAKRAVEVTLARWQQRSFTQKAKAGAAYLLNDLL